MKFGSSAFSATGIIALILSLSTPAYGGTLLEAVEEALRTNPDVLIDASRQQSAGAASVQALGGYLPRIDLSLGRGPSRSDNATTLASYGGAIHQRRYDRSLTLTQMLFDGFGTSSEVNRNRARYISASEKREFTSEQVALRVVENYLEVLRQQEIITLTQENLNLHQRTFDQIKLRASSGVGRKSDQDQIEARLALSRANLASAEANLQVAEINYKMVVGSMPKMLVKPKAPDVRLMPKNIDLAIRAAMANTHILKSARADVDAAIAQHQSAKSSLYPRLDLELSANKNDLVSPTDNQKDLNHSVMLRMRYNLFKGGSDAARVTETWHLAEEAKEIMRRAELQLEQSVRLSWNAHTSAKERLPHLLKHAESSQLTRDAYSKQFSLGQRTLLDLLDTENEYYTASVNNLNGIFVEMFSRYRLLADMGLLLETLGVSQRQ